MLRDEVVPVVIALEVGINDINGTEQKSSRAGGRVEDNGVRQATLEAEFVLQLLVDSAGDELDEFRRRVEDASPFAVKATMLGEEMLEEMGEVGMLSFRC